MSKAVVIFYKVIYSGRDDGLLYFRIQNRSHDVNYPKNIYDYSRATHLVHSITPDSAHIDKIFIKNLFFHLLRK